jgi:parvulin-like peptidyl-prolyl isomerase
MSNPTLQSPKRPSSQRPAQQRRRQKTQQTAVTFRKQTARLEGRRDGTPLIFGWGGHLTRAQKTRIQQRAAYSFFGVVTALVIGVFLFGVLQQLVLIPNSTIVKINDVSVSQDTYRKQLAYDAQDLWNQMQANIATHDRLNDQVQKGDTSVNDQLAAVTANVEAEEGNYGQSTITQNTIGEITEDQLIQQGAARFEKQDPSARAKLEPTAAAITKKWQDFKAAFPGTEKYTDFLAKNNMSDSDVKTAIAVHLRRDLMQAYLAAQLTSPERQVHLRHVEASTKDLANQALADLQKAKLLSTSASWSDIAKKESVDTDTKDNGGDLGWVPPGHGDAGIEIWAYNPSRKVGDYAVVATAGGTFDVVQVLGIDPSRKVDPSLLKSTQDNALSHYLGGERVATYNTISTADSDMVSASRNLPQLPNLNATLPNYNPQNNQSGGLPGA